MPAQTVSQQADDQQDPSPDEIRDLAKTPGGGGNTVPPAVKEVAEAKKPEQLPDETIIDATDWFLSQEVEPMAWDQFDVDVSADPHKRKWVRFKIESIPRDMLKQIRTDATDPNTGIEDDVLMNELTAIQGMTSPDLSDPRLRGGMADPKDALRKMLGHKPLVIDTIARRVLALSGGSLDAVREVPENEPPADATEVSAAGN